MIPNIELIIASTLGVVVGGYVILIFNTLVTLKKSMTKNWANIDVILKQRNDELPKLVSTCQEYMGYEKSTLTAITQARQMAIQAMERNDLTTLGQAESVLHSQLGKLFALAEAYPDLKANSSFSHLQLRISDLENSIADRRELYNESVNLNNIRISQFPDMLVAKLFCFKEGKFLEFSKQDLEDVDLSKLFKS